MTAPKNPVDPREKAITEIAKGLNPAVFDDMRFLEALDEIDRGADPLGLSRIFSRILSPASKERLYKVLERPDGTVPIEEATKALIEIMNRSKAAKK